MRFRSPISPLRVVLCIFLATLAIAFNWSSLTYAQGQQPGTLTLDDDQILHHLSNVITWYRHTKTQIQPSGLPTDTVYQANAEAFAAEVAKYAFSSAEAAAPLVPSESSPTATPTSRQNLLKSEADTAARNAQLENQISDLNGKIASASKRNVQALKDQRELLQGELDLGKSMLNALVQLTKSPTQKGQPANGFLSSVTQLKTSLPEVFDTKAKTAVPSGQPSAVNSPTGLISKLRRLYDQSVSLRQIDTLNIETNQLEDVVNGLRTPLRAAMRATIQQGRTLSSMADNPQAGQAAPTRQDFDALAAKFDQVAAAEVPLSQEVRQIDQYKANLADWRTSIASEYKSILREVFIRVALIVGVLGFLLLISDLWKRLTFRYVGDTRRRRQFLLIRRIVIGFFIGLVFIFSFVSEFSALATFAGFITAGLAVGLQTILLSVAAYFFLMGRYGLRVGDRVTIAGVTGDVIEVGFVRFYLLELAGTGIDLQPTGRVVAFANSVLFQATSPMFKQVPGTDYAWHEIAIALNPLGDHTLVEQNMLKVVNAVYEKYQAVLDQQQSNIERRFEIPFSPLKPKAQLQFSDTGLEAVVRYPVGLRHSVEADDQITRALIEMIGKDETLKASVSGLPKIRAAIRG